MPVRLGTVRATPIHVPNLHSRTAIRLGFVPLNDCAPVAVAHELGIFGDYGLDVRLCRLPGWATVRDMLFYRELEAAQSIAGLAFSLGLGFGRQRRHVGVPLILSAHGNAITLSQELPPDLIGNGEGLAAFMKYRWKKERPLTLAAAHRHSSHHILLVNWLHRHGIQPGRDLELVFLPPQLMPGSLTGGHIDGYCVGEPWNSAAVLTGSAWCPATSADLATGHPEKILLVDGEFIEDRQEETILLTSALLHACRVCQQPDFREELISILARPSYTDCPAETLSNSLGPKFSTGRGELDARDFHLFHGGSLNEPSPDKASWFFSGLRSTGLLPEDAAPGPIAALYRQDLYRAAEARVLTA